MAKDSSLTWTEIDPMTLPKQQAAAYQEYKEAYRLMKAMRGKFEDSFQPAAPDGKRFVFGYNFGKLSIALADKPVEKAKAVAKQSIGEYLAQMQQNGRPC
jgi:hypothetical protein